MRAARSLNPSTVWTVPDNFRAIYAHACEFSGAGRLLFLSGQYGVARDGTLAADFAAQCEQAMDNVEALLAAAGMTKADLVKITYLVVRTGDLPSLGDIRRRRWASAEPPAVTAFAVAALARSEYLVEIEAVAAA